MDTYQVVDTTCLQQAVKTARSPRLLTLLADNTLSGEKVATALDKALLQRGVPESITVDKVLTQEGKAAEKKRSLGIPYGMCLKTTVLPSGFREQGAEHSTIATRDLPGVRSLHCT